MKVGKVGFQHAQITSFSTLKNRYFETLDYFFIFLFFCNSSIKIVGFFT